MATVTFIRAKTQSKVAMSKVMAYCARADKTQYEGYNLISGKDCCAETAFKEFVATKNSHGKAHGMFYYQYVQSFAPGEIEPQKAHEIGLRLAEYFRGHEVLVATHTDREHIHTHLIINSVGFDSGKKLQMARGSIHDLRRYSDEICMEYELEIVKPAQKNNLQTREYRAALKGESWKFKLINTIDLAMKEAKSRAAFIQNMRRRGYDVRWEAGWKSITYTTPDGQKCRDNKLHDEKYLKEKMEEHFGQRQVEGAQPTRELAEQLPFGGSAVRDPTGSFEEFAGEDYGSRFAARADAGADNLAAELGELTGRDTTSHRNGAGAAESGFERWSVEHREHDEQGFAGTAGSTFADDHNQDHALGTTITDAGFYPTENQVDLFGGGHISAADFMGLAVGLSNLVIQPAEKEPPAPPPPRERQRQKRGHDMSL